MTGNANTSPHEAHHPEMGNQEFQMYTFHQHSLLEQAAEHRKVVAEQQTTDKTEKGESV
jgi:hypothetical protein